MDNQTSFSGNVLVIDYDSSVSWTSLKAIGRNTGDGQTADDFEEIDEAINTTIYIDSVNSTYTAQSLPKETGTARVFGTTLNNVPYVNSTNTGSFKTGILWDMSDVNTGEYNGTQDLVFINRINVSKLGAYGTYDYEIRVPSRLKSYKGSNELISFYIDIN